MNGHKPRNTRTFKLFSYGWVLCVWEFSYCLHFKNLYFTKLTPYSVLILNHNLNFNEFPTWNTGLIIKNNNRFKKWTFVGRVDLFCPTLTKMNLFCDLFSSKIIFCNHCKIYVFSIYSETKIVFGSNNVTHLVQV